MIRLHYCRECARDKSIPAVLRKGLLIVALTLGCLAIFAQTPAENSIRLSEVERRIVPIDDLVVHVAKIETTLQNMVAQAEARDVRNREILGGIILLFAEKLIGAFGISIRKKG